MANGRLLFIDLLRIIGIGFVLAEPNFKQTPVYRIQFTSPYDGQEIEWYYDLSSRVARIEDNVVSYVNYSDQLPDKYLNSSSPINWLSPSSLANGIDDSLAFKIDALGGGWGNPPVATQPAYYKGYLAYFQDIS
jgi:hypothetical protein